MRLAHEDGHLGRCGRSSPRRTPLSRSSTAALTPMSDRSLKKKLRAKAKKAKRRKIAKALEADGHHKREKKR